MNLKLIQTAASDGTRCNASDALIAHRIWGSNYMIASPNADWIPDYPIAGPDGIRVYDDGLLGGQEFTRWPQLHVPGNIHHALIPFRRYITTSIINDDDAIWYRPSESDTIRCEGLDVLRQPLAKFKSSLVKNLTRCFEMCLASARNSYGALSEKEYTPLMDDMARRGRANLDVLSSTSQGWYQNIICFREVQRMSLELLGIAKYASVLVPRIKDVTRNHPLLPVRGAFTYDPSTVAYFHALGIPVWHLRPLPTKSTPIKVFNVLRESTFWDSVMSSQAFYVNGDISRPVLSHARRGLDIRTADFVWTDQGMKDLVSSMIREGKEARRRFEQPVALHQAQLCSTIDHPFSATIVHSRSSSTTETHLARSTKKGKSALRLPSISRPERKTTKSAIHHENNRPRSQYFFVPNSPVDGSPDFPPHCRLIRRIFDDVGEVDKDSNIPAYYVMPPPFLLVHHDSDKSIRFYHNYLNIRGAVMRLAMRDGTFRPVYRKLGEWVNVLIGNYRNTDPVALEFTSEGLARLYKTLEDSTTNHHDRPEQDVRPSKKAKRASLAAMKVTFGSEYNLPAYTPDIRPLWRGVAITPDMIRADKHLRMEMQWELNELSFRSEFAALHKTISQGRSSDSVYQSKEERQQLRRVFCCVDTGSELSFFPDVSQRQIAYWSDDHVDPDSLTALSSVLSSWPGFDPTWVERPIDYKSHLTLACLLNFYVRTFINYYSRIPALPSLPPKTLS